MVYWTSFSISPKMSCNEEFVGNGAILLDGMRVYEGVCWLHEAETFGSDLSNV